LKRLRPTFQELFPFGKAPLLMLVIALVSGAWLALHPVRESGATLKLWTFVYSNWLRYEDRAPQFEESHPGATVEIQNIAFPALVSRLRSAFWADLDVPDIVELEIGGAGSFFRGPVEDLGFRDLTPFIEKNGLQDSIPAGRLAPYRNRGQQLGLPMDIHPVMIAYRRDLFEKYGINADSLETYDDFIEAGRRVTQEGKRYMIQLSDSRENHFEMFLFQSGGGYFDPDGELVMDDATALEVLRWYIPLVAGPDRIGNDLGSDQVFTQAIEEGYFLCILAPDWLAHHIGMIVPGAEGKMALMPLPAFEPGGRRTSTAGGTMIGITRACEDPELAWELIEFLALDPKLAAERFRETGVVPPLREAWELPALQEPKPYWSNQPVGALFARLAPEVPPQYASPYMALAKAKMGDVVASCAAYYRANGAKGFDEFSARRLKQAADEVRRAMTRNPFE
jgi:arabinosaccharide transport system substrate-binding protein